MEISFPLHLITWHKIKKQLLAFFVHALVIDSRGFLEEVVTSVNPLFSQENHEASVTVGEQEEHSTNEDCGYRDTISTPAGDVTVASNGWLSCSEAEKPGDPPSFLFSVVWQQTLLKHWSHTGSMWWEVMCALILDTHFSRQKKRLNRNSIRCLCNALIFQFGFSSLLERLQRCKPVKQKQMTKQSRKTAKVLWLTSH